MTEPTPSDPSRALSPEAFAEKLSKHPRLIIADDYELAIQRTATRSRRYTDGRAGATSQHERIWVSLRLLHRKQPGRAVVTSLSEDSIKALVDSAFEAARRSSVDPWFRFPMWRSLPRDTTSPNSFSPLTVSEACEPGEVAIEESFEASWVQTLLRRKSEKFTLNHSRSYFGSALSASTQDENLSVRLNEFRSYSFMPPEAATWAPELARRTRERLYARPATASELGGAFVFAPPASAVLVRMLASMLGADLAQRGDSPLCERLGQTVLSREVDLVDDGGLLGGPGATPFDLEGIQTQRTVLFDRGVLKSFLYDSYTATRENRRSTGNFLRAPDSLHPKVRVSHLFVPNGVRTRAELLGMVPAGIWLENIESVDGVAGDPQSFRIRGSGSRLAHGQRAEPVKEISLQFNVLELFGCAAAVADDLEHYGSFGSPSILFPNMPLR